MDHNNNNNNDKTNKKKLEFQAGFDGNQNSKVLLNQHDELQDV